VKQVKTFYTIIIIALVYVSSNGQVAVIANLSLNKDSINKIELLDCYTGDIKKLDNDQKIYVFDLKPKTKTKEIFYKFLGKSPSRMKTIWMKKMLSGDGDPPPSLESEEEMLKKVEKTKGAIGFVQYSLVSSKVKVLAIIEEEKD
jgi:ABC-type phosphate transport system substrate-binding protein